MKVPLTEELRLFIERIGQTLRETRRERGWLQEQLGARAGVAGTRIGEIERGTVDFSISRLARLAKALDVPVWRLLKRADHLRPSEERLAEDRARAARLLQRLAPADLDLVVLLLGRLAPRDETK